MRSVASVPEYLVALQHMSEAMCDVALTSSRHDHLVLHRNLSIERFAIEGWLSSCHYLLLVLIKKEYPSLQT